MGDSSRECCRVPWPHPVTISPDKTYIPSLVSFEYFQSSKNAINQQNENNYPYRSNRFSHWSVRTDKCVLSFNVCTFLPFQISFLVTTCFWSNHYSDANFSISFDKVVPSLKLLWCNLWPHMMIMEVADEMLTLGLGGIVVYVVVYTVRTVGSKLVTNTG